MTTLKEVRKVIVHSTVFHTDDVMCIAFLNLVLGTDRVKQITTRKLDISTEELNDPTVLVLDIGRSYNVELNNFDHHQQDCPPLTVNYYDADKKACAFSLLFDAHAEELMDEKVKKSVWNTIVKPTALADNGQVKFSRDVHSIGQVISSFNPTWDIDYTETYHNIRFWQAVELATTVLFNIINRATASVRARRLVIQSETEGSTLILDNALPWNAWITHRQDYEELYQVLYPSLRGGWSLQVVPIKPSSFEAKRPLPEEWLEEHPEGCRFVHNARFLAAFETKEAALKAAATIK